MSQQLEALGVLGALKSTRLQDKLLKLAMSPIVETANGNVLEPLLPAFELGQVDNTGFEALANKIHISDYVDSEAVEVTLVQGILYSETLAGRLSQLKGQYCVFLNVDSDSDEVTARWFTVRKNELWGPEDPQRYVGQGIAVWKTPLSIG